MIERLLSVPAGVTLCDNGILGVRTVREPDTRATSPRVARQNKTFDWCGVLTHADTKTGRLPRENIRAGGVPIAAALSTTTLTACG